MYTAFSHRKSASKPEKLMSADIRRPFNESSKKQKYFVVYNNSFSKFKTKEKVEVLVQIIQHQKISVYSSEIAEVVMEEKLTKRS